jgi:hypothetical protein
VQVPSLGALMVLNTMQTEIRALKNPDQAQVNAIRAQAEQQLLNLQAGGEGATGNSIDVKA